VNTPVPSLVIGLGGSGAWTVVHIKRQLLDAYGNEIPPNVALVALDTLDTAERAIAWVGSRDVKREAGSGVGGVTLDPTEYAYIGGDAYDLVMDVAKTDRYAHLDSWLLADYLLRNLPRGQFNLDQGAGMFRQLGRLALFRDLLNPATSAAKQVIENKFLGIARDAGADTSVSVMIVGSLTGGTGAGLFLDIAHLVRRVAAVNNIGVTVRGFFYLPQAFRAVLNDTALESARQRSFAALRELQRFTLHENYDFGYPMRYVSETAGQDQRVYRSEVREKLYDFAYLVDGDGQRKKMSARKLESGVASVVADSIVAYIDHHYGNYQNQYIANIRAAVVDRQTKTGRRAYVGSLGSYSIILPIQSIIEGWAYKLGLDTLYRLVTPGRVTDDKGYIIELSPAANPMRTEMRPDEEAERILASNVEIRDPHDETGRRRFAPLPLWRHAHGFFNEMRYNEQNAARTLGAYNLEGWLRILTPPATEADPTIRRVMGETRSILQEAVFDSVQTSNVRRPQGDPTVDWRDIGKRSENYIVRQLGQVESGGYRQGGQYGDALKQLAELQVARFKEAMGAYIMNTLNGDDAPNPIYGRSGKLGWLLAVMEEVKLVFNTAYRLLEMVRQGMSVQAMQNRRRMMDEGLEASGRAMRDRAGDKSMFGKSPAIQAQEMYLVQVQDYVEFHRTELARDYVGFTFKAFGDFLTEVIEELGVWKQVLATDDKSLYTMLLDGMRRIQNEKRSAADVENHWIINDPTWEEERFREFMDTERADEQILVDWKWDTRLVENQRGKLSLSLHAMLDGAEIRKDIGYGKWNVDNLNAILSYSRHVFRAATARHNVLNYLMMSNTATGPDNKPINFVQNPRGLGDFLYAQSGHQLAIRSGAGETPTNAILAAFDERSENRQREYLRDALAQLAARQGVGDIGHGMDSKLHTIMACDDPFRLTLLSGVELVPIDYVDAYDKNQADYLKLVKDARQITHIFPAEVRAVAYEEALPLLKQQRRILNDQVSVLFEDEDRFRQFLYLFAYRIVRPVETSFGGEKKHFWALQMPSADPRQRDAIEDYMLTEADYDPSFLEAAFTYVLVQKDVRTLRKNENWMVELPNANEAAKYLDKKRREVAAKLIDRDELALDDPDLRKWLEAFMPPVDEEGNEILDNWTDQDEDAFLDIAEMVVQHDVLSGLAYDLKEHLGVRIEELNDMRHEHATHMGHDELIRKEAEYDLFSVAVIALQNQLEVLRRTIRTRYNEHVGISDWGGVTGSGRGDRR